MAKKQVAVSLRKPPSPDKADAFVSGGAGTVKKGAPREEAKREPEAKQEPEAEAKQEAEQAPEPEAAPGGEASAPAAETQAAASPEPPPVAPVLVGIDGRARRAVTIYLPNPLADRLLLHCLEQDRDMSNVIGEALEDHLQRRLGPGPGATTPGAPRDGSSPSGAPFHADPFRGVDAGGPQGRIDRFLQVGRVLIALWRQRPWSGQA